MGDVVIAVAVAAAVFMLSKQFAVGWVLFVSLSTSPRHRHAHHNS